MCKNPWEKKNYIVLINVYKCSYSIICFCHFLAGPGPVTILLNSWKADLEQDLHGAASDVFQYI